MDDETPESQTPPTPAEQVGAALKQARSARGQSLESVCQHTRIPRRYLEAMENGRFDELPAPVYMRSFLKGYCDCLELEFDPFWEALHPPAAPPTPPAPLAGAAGAAPETQPPAAAPAQAADEHDFSIPLERSPYLAALVNSAGALLLSVVLVVGLVLWVTRSPKPAGSSGGGERQPSEGPDSPGRSELLAPLRPAVEPRLSLILRDDAWLSLRADGALLFEGRAPKNARQEWKAQRSIVLRTAQPESLDLNLNGAPYRLPRPEADGSYRIEAP